MITTVKSVQDKSQVIGRYKFLKSILAATGKIFNLAFQNLTLVKLPILVKLLGSKYSCVLEGKFVGKFNYS